MAAGPHKLIVVGKVSGLYGVRGWVRIQSYTEPVENIMNFGRWYVGREGGWREMRSDAGRRQGRTVVAHMVAHDDRDASVALVGLDIAVERDQLPEPAAGEYYWADLQGLAVRTVDGAELGVVDHVMATGANDVLVVKGDRERLIPFLQGRVVRRVNLDEGWLEVDWDAEF